jgi:hypothetical protein
MGTPKHLTDPARFFLEPVQARHRQYEALRAYFVEHRPSVDVARTFGYTPGSFRVLCHHFLHNPERVFFVEPRHGPQKQPKKSRARQRSTSPRTASGSACLDALTTRCCSTPACSRRPSPSPGGEVFSSRSSSLIGIR